MNTNDSKRMKPEECADLYTCDVNDHTHMPCPIQQWCFSHVFSPDTCEETWRQYLAAQDADTL